MTGHEWKVLAAFGLLLGGLSLYDAGFAVKVGGVAMFVVLVRNSDKIPLLNVGSQPSRSSSSSPSSPRPAPAGSGTLHV